MSKISIDLPQSPIGIAQRFTGRAPVNLVGMAEALGIIVNDAAQMDDPETSGSIRRLSGDNYLIEVNGTDGPLRRRFTLAHEIAHFILHRDLINKRALVDDAMWRSGASEKEEYQANRLAADLLMPAGLVRTLWGSGVTDIKTLARTFMASERAMEIRLNQLGLHAPDLEFAPLDAEDVSEQPS